VLGRPRHELPGTATHSTNWPTFLQVAVALILIVGGARLFVDAVDAVATRFGLSHLVFALLVAPVATELPEKFNSVIWVRRRKDTLALGNMTGAMVFQSSFPVTVGLLLTPWHLAHEALVAGAIALAAGTVLYLTVRVRGRFSAPLLLLQGAFYATYVVYVLTRPGITG
jgi:cation:H+ antiporter